MTNDLLPTAFMASKAKTLFESFYGLEKDRLFLPQGGTSHPPPFRRLRHQGG